MLFTFELDLTAHGVPNGALQILDAGENGFAELESFVLRICPQFIGVQVILVEVRGVHWQLLLEIFIALRGIQVMELVRLEEMRFVNSEVERK